MTVDPVDLSKIADGTYPGSFKTGRFSYSVKVTVKDQRIEGVKVDTVSGASLTTKAASKAVENALRPAR